jgi:UDPglucose 6-dehydrogenase
MNEIYMLAQKLGLDYEKVAEMVVCDDRIGKSHMQVPGPEGLFGFGGMCFPKDTSALIKFAEQVSVHVNVVDAAVKKNTLLRLTKT